jgi:hypothetical protein
MNRLAKYLLLVLTVTPVSANELPEGAWVPDPHFKIDGGTHAETLHFIAGVGYGLTYSRAVLMQKGMKNFFCMPPEEKFVGSQLLIEILNEAKKEDLSSAEASVLIIKGLMQRYPC